MANYHNVLLNQLQRLGLDTQASDPVWLKLLDLVSNTYKDYDEYRYAMERSVEIASEEINLINTKYETQLKKINTVSYDGILTTDVDWKITSLNLRGTSILKISDIKCINTLITEHLMFLNAQKIPLDFIKLKNHFECGNQYVCQKGLIINLSGEGHEVFVSFTIAPFYLNNHLNSYVIIFRDITQDILKETETTLHHLKHRVAEKNKEKVFQDCAKTVLINNHNGAFATEFHQVMGNETSQLIEQFILSQAIESNIQTLNNVLVSTSPLENLEQSFYIDDKLAHIKKGLIALDLAQEVTVKNHINQPIHTDISQFEQLIYELVTLSKTVFKSANLIDIAFAPVDANLSFRPWIKLLFTLQTAYALPDEFIQTNVAKIRDSLTTKYVDTMVAEAIDQQIVLQITLKIPRTSQLEQQATKVIPPMRCLFFLAEQSLVLKQMQEEFVLNQLDYVEVTTAETAVQHIKEARLNKTEFNLIISDREDFAALEDNVLDEISSYINNKFLGLIYLHDSPPTQSSRSPVKVYTVPNNPLLEELRGVLYALRASYLHSNDLVTTAIGQLPTFGKTILFIDLEHYSQALYLQLFEEIGLTVCLGRATEMNQANAAENFAAIFINANHDVGTLLLLLTNLNKQFPNVPLCLFAPPLHNDELSQILAHKIEKYLIKPFAIQELLFMLQDKFRDA